MTLGRRLPRLTQLLLAVFTLTVTPTVGFAPTKIEVKARRVYEEGDRWIRLAVYCGNDLIRASDRQLHPANPTTYTMSADLASVCDYTVEASVGRNDGSILVKTQTVRVVE